MALNKDGVLARIDQKKGVRLLMDLINIPSPTGSEKGMADYLAQRFRKMGMKVKLQEVEDNRFNCIGILPGSGGGPSLMFNGHMDTSLTGLEEHDLSVVGEMHDGFRPRAFIDDGYVRGLGAWNMKHALACYIMAAEAIIRSKVKLKGDLVIAGVVGEIEKTPVKTLTKTYQGPLYRGAGCGTRFLATHGIRTDYAVIGEVNDLHITTAHPGYCWFRLTCRGRFTRTTAISRGVNAIKKMTRVINALDSWGEKYTERERRSHERHLKGHPYSVVKPNVNIGAIEGGWPFKPTWSTAVCNLYVDIRTIPGKPLTEVESELNDLLKRLEREDPQLNVRAEMYMSNPGGGLANPDSPVVHAAEKAIQRVRGKKPGRLPEEFASYWCDINILNRMGIEAITVGPGHEKETRWDGKGEYCSVHDLVQGAQVYALMALDVCSKERGMIRGNREKQFIG